MTRDKAKELLPIIQGFTEGREIQHYSPTLKEWIDNNNPDWFDRVEYRLKERPVYVPFNEGDADLIRDQWIKSINSDIEYKISVFHPIGSLPIYLPLGSGEWISYENLLNRFTFLDGSPCGKLKQ